MNTYLVYFQYQGDDRCQNAYRAYCKTDNEDEVSDKIYELSDYSLYEDLCKSDYQEYFEENENYNEDDNWVGLSIENITNDEFLNNSDWFNNLTCLIDER